MKKIRLMVTVAAVGVLVNVALAQTPPLAQTKPPVQERVYGSQLMTEQERDEFRLHMRALKTPAERMQFRAEHHARMQERAKERGVTLPDETPMQGQGAGPRGPGGGGGRP